MGGFSDDDAEYGAEQYAKDERLRIYTTVIGIGIGMTSHLKSRLLGLRGCNVVNVRKTEELMQYFEQREKFMSLVTPIFYDIVLKLQQDTMEIDEVFGTKNRLYIEHLKKRGQISKTYTMFAHEAEKELKSGVLLIKLEPKDVDEKRILQSTIAVSYEDREECDYSNSKSVVFDKKKSTYFDGIAIRKSILLCQFAKLLMAWINDTQSLDGSLMINAKHKRRFANFMKHFE